MVLWLELVELWLWSVSVDGVLALGVARGESGAVLEIHVA